MTSKGKPRLLILDDGDETCLPVVTAMLNGDETCLPVVTAMLNPECGFTFDDIDLQHVLSQHHWYVSGYKMGFLHPLTEKNIPLFTDRPADQTMFRVVVKSNLTRDMAKHLLASFSESFELLERLDFSGVHGLDSTRLRHKDQRVITNHC